MFRTIVKRVLQGLLPVQEAVASTLVGQEAQPLVAPAVMAAPQPAIVDIRNARCAASAGRTKKFRHTDGFDHLAAVLAPGYCILSLKVLA